MVQMSVRKQDRLDGFRRQSQLRHLAPEKEHFTGQAGIQHHAIIAILQQKAAAEQAPYGMQLRRIILHPAQISDQLDFDH